MSYQLFFTRMAQKDAKKLSSSGLKETALELLNILKSNPFESPPSFEKLIGKLSGAYSRRINVKHRLVYQVIEEQKLVKILRMWSHYT